MYVDGELGDGLKTLIVTHLADCPDCAKLFEDLSMILTTCRIECPDEIVPPNSRALWCRISNTIESERKIEPEPEVPQPGWLGAKWRFSFSQIGSAVVAVAVISSLLTIVGIRNYLEPANEDYTSRSNESQTTFEKILSKVGLTDTPQQARTRRLHEQEIAIEYWNQRVQTRRAQWNSQMREAFDRNLYEYDQAIQDYTTILQKNPQDDLSGEMLDSAMNEKMKLLRAFAEL